MFAFLVSRLSFQLKNGPCFSENIVIRRASLPALDFRDARQKSLISKGNFSANQLMCGTIIRNWTALFAYKSAVANSPGATPTGHLL
jgi:hypothetical protein